MNASDFWKNAGKKALSLGRTVLEKTAADVVDSAIVIAVQKACEKINEKINSMFRTSVINSCITLAVNIAGMLIVIFLPFGEIASKYIGSACFIGALVFFWVRFIRFWVKNGKTVFKIVENIWQEKSIGKGINAFVFSEFPAVAMAYTGIEIAGNYVPALKRVPQIPELTHTFISMFWKKLAVFAVIMAVYTVSVFWVLKPMLLNAFSTAGWAEIYFFPFVYTWRLIFHK